MHTFNKVINTLCKSQRAIRIQKALDAARAVSIEHISHSLGRGLHAGIEPVFDHSRYGRNEQLFKALRKSLAHIPERQDLLLEVVVGVLCNDLEHRVMVAVRAGKDAAKLSVFAQKPQRLQRCQALKPRLLKPLRKRVGKLILQAPFQLIRVGIVRVERAAVYVRLASDIRHAYFFDRFFGEQTQKAIPDRLLGVSYSSVFLLWLR